MTDHRTRRGLPERWLLPPPPREPQLATRWDALAFEDRRRLAATSGERLTDLPEEETELVVGLARARLATSWRLLLAAPVLGWLVFMTVWGFGRSTYPDAADTYLLVGLSLGAIAWMLAAIAAARRLRRAREVAAIAWLQATQATRAADAEPDADANPADRREA